MPRFPKPPSFRHSIRPKGVVVAVVVAVDVTEVVNEDDAVDETELVSVLLTEDVAVVVTEEMAHPCKIPSANDTSAVFKTVASSKHALRFPECTMRLPFDGNPVTSEEHTNDPGRRGNKRTCLTTSFKVETEAEHCASATPRSTNWRLEDGGVRHCTDLLIIA